MGTTADKLNVLVQNKNNIKQALLEVGANVDDNMSGYAKEIKKFANAYSQSTMIITGKTSGTETSISIPTNITEIRSYAFYEVGRYESSQYARVEMNNENLRLSSIGPSAFYYCNLKNGLKLITNENATIYKEGFAHCKVFGDVYVNFKGKLNESAFYNLELETKNNIFYFDVETMPKTALHLRVRSNSGLDKEIQQNGGIKETIADIHFSNKLNSLTSRSVSYAGSSSYVPTFNLYLEMSLQEYIDKVGTTYYTNSSFSDDDHKTSIFYCAKNVYFNGELAPNKFTVKSSENAISSSGNLLFGCASFVEEVIVGTTKRTLSFVSCQNLKKAEILSECYITPRFSLCTALEEVIIQEGVERVNIYAFKGCTSLKYIVIPSSVKNFFTESLAMGSSTNKATIVFKGTVPPAIYVNTFTASNLEKIIVPTGTIDTYKSATNWSAFADYIIETKVVTVNIPDELKNNENVTYSIDGGQTYNKFIRNEETIEDIGILKIKSTDSTQTIIVGSASGGSDLGTISNSEITLSFTTDTTIYLTIQ